MDESTPGQPRARARPLRRLFKPAATEKRTEPRVTDPAQDRADDKRARRCQIRCPRSPDLVCPCHERLTEPERRALERIRAAGGVVFDEGNEVHEVRLARLWTLLRPDEGVCPKSSLQWKGLGFQGENPRTDFRGAGLLALQCLVYMAEQYTQDLLLLVEESASLHHYPVAAALINVTHFLVVFLRLTEPSIRHLSPAKPSRPANKRCIKAFARLACAFEELFCASALFLHRSWKQKMQAGSGSITLLAFNSTFYTLQEGVRWMLSQRPSGVGDFHRMLSQHHTKKDKWV
ncbi:unnamed protein product [Vitrella brassicaformis CCMP3155]|uniref:ELMO domain-containing protein n=1 Tax=Vitrella brassicaformis (strain CCMP3155) TaxID=1169540 RepID=A0A0G4GWZ1_VITBC|nr:unnamed protein product [Vitrella brassicaformis CCMP3155]|eukprot:CEM35566.1 unnamed protein product [Vitrella brassicaformis CCMP3155]